MGWWKKREVDGLVVVASGRGFTFACPISTHKHTYPQEMKAEMSKVCGNKEVRIGTGPRLEVKGRFTRELRGWLAGLGF